MTMNKQTNKRVTLRREPAGPACFAKRAPKWQWAVYFDDRRVYSATDKELATQFFEQLKKNVGSWLH